MTAGILISGILPAMSQETETNPEEETAKLSFDVDSNPQEKIQNFIKFNAEDDETQEIE